MKTSLGFVAMIALAIAGCGGEQSSAKEGKTAGDESHGTNAGGGGAAEAASSGEGVKIESPSEAAAAHESRNIEMQFDLTLLKKGAPSGIQSGSWSIYEERSTKVLAVKDRAIQKLQLVFGRREAKPLLGVEKPSVTAGKSYVIEGSGGEATIKTPAGKDVTAAEKSAVAAEYGYVGRPNPLLEMLSGVKPGDSAEPSAEARRLLIGELPGIDHEQSKLGVKLVGVEQHTAKLELELGAEIDNGDMKFTLDLKGPAEIDVRTGWVKSLDLSGKVKASGTVVAKKKEKLDATGKGSAKISRKAELH